MFGLFITWVYSISLNSPNLLIDSIDLCSLSEFGCDNKCIISTLGLGNSPFHSKWPLLDKLLKYSSSIMNSLVSINLSPLKILNSTL